MSLNLSYKLENHDKIEILKSLKIKYIVWKKIKLYPYLIAYSEINSGLNRIKLAKWSYYLLNENMYLLKYLYNLSIREGKDCLYMTKNAMTLKKW